MPSGVSIGVNEKEEYPPGSLVKIPIIMGVYKNLESGKLKSDQLLTLRDKDELYGDFWKQPEGTKISLNKAIEKTRKEFKKLLE